MQRNQRGEKRSRDKTFGDPELGDDSGPKRDWPTHDDDRRSAEKSAASDRDAAGGGGGESKSEPVASPPPEADAAKKSACATAPPPPTNAADHASLFFVGACGHAVVRAVDEPTRRCIARHAAEYVGRLISSAPPPASLLELAASKPVAVTATTTVTTMAVATVPSTAHVQPPPPPPSLAADDAAETLVAWENAYAAFNAAMSDRRELLARRDGALALIRAALWLTRSDSVAAETATAAMGLWRNGADRDGGAPNDDADGWGRFSAASNVLRAYAMAIRQARHAPRFAFAFAPLLFSLLGFRPIPFR